jgi:hypothetical protein
LEKRIKTMSREVNVRDDAVVIVLTPKQAVKLGLYLRGVSHALDSTIKTKLLNAVDIAGMG